LGAEVVVLVTCTNRKTVPPSPALTLRTVPGKSIQARCEKWVKRLSAAPGDPVACASLYAGDHWQVVRSLGAVAARKDLALTTYVCSAGYGLIPLDAPLHSYGLGHARGREREGKRGAARLVVRTWCLDGPGGKGPAHNRSTL
jgi:hypothetical protein